MYPAALVAHVSSLCADERQLTLGQMAEEAGVGPKVIRAVMANHTIATPQHWLPVADRERTAFTDPGAYCRDMDTSAFYPERSVDLRRATLPCREHCLVMEACLRHALDQDEREGVWGGCTPGDRRRIAAAWDGVTQLTVDCESCETGFVPTLDGPGPLCRSCRRKGRRAKRVA